MSDDKIIKAAKRIMEKHKDLLQSLTDEPTLAYAYVAEHFDYESDPGAIEAYKAWLAGHAAGRAEASKLVDALDRAVEVMQFAYMNAPEQPCEIAEALSALAQFRGAK